MSKLNVILAGTGNLSHHLLKAFQASRHVEVIQVFNHRKTKQATDLCQLYRVPLVTTVEELNREADIYLLCVKDEAIEKLARSFKLSTSEALLLHTSGSIGMEALQKKAKHIGVLYPLQTFSKQDQDLSWENAPVLIEGNTQHAKQVLTHLAAYLSSNVVYANSARRLRLHLGAVMAANFSNAMYTMAYQFLSKELDKKNFELLKPLIAQTSQKVMKMAPSDAQTGPARRHDETVMKKHLALLKRYPDMKELYIKISAFIQDNEPATS